MDYSYHTNLLSTLNLHSAAEEGIIQSRNGCLDLLRKRLKDVDQKLDKQNFLDLHPDPFQAPNPFEFQAYKDDQVGVEVAGCLSYSVEIVDKNCYLYFIHFYLYNFKCLYQDEIQNIFKKLKKKYNHLFYS